MRLIIAGSRTVAPDVTEVDAAFADSPFNVDLVTEVVRGGASGADRAGEEWAKARSLPVHYEPVTDADYAAHGKYSGPRYRNRRMAEIADAALIFWDGMSAGSADMAIRMIARKKPVHVVPTKRAPRRRAR